MSGTSIARVLGVFSSPLSLGLVMKRHLTIGFGLVLLLLGAGCGSNDDDAVMREGIAHKEEGARIWEGVTDAASLAEAKQKMKAWNKRIGSAGQVVQ